MRRAKGWRDRSHVSVSMSAATLDRDAYLKVVHHIVV